jgi:hypothetical protein
VWIYLFNLIFIFISSEVLVIYGDEQVKLKDELMTWETQDGSTTWVWWKASATFPGHFGVFQAKAEDTKGMSS